MAMWANRHGKARQGTLSARRRRLWLNALLYLTAVLSVSAHEAQAVEVAELGCARKGSRTKTGRETLTSF